MARRRRRLIRGATLGADGLLLGEKRVAGWRGGRLRVVVRQLKLEAGVPVDQLPIEEVDLGTSEHVAFGDCLALPTYLETAGVEIVEHGLRFHVGIRDGRPSCLGISSTDTGPALTTAMLKSGRIPAIGRIVRELVTEFAVRVVRTPAREIIGVLATSTGDPWSTFAERTSDVDMAIDEIESRARRWRLTDEHLEEVAQVYRDALAQNRSTEKAIVDRWKTTPGNARRWVLKARKAGYLPPTVERKARG